MVHKEILIIGAGISGLVAARHLIRAGLSVGMLEARDRTGGRILSIDLQGTTIEAGPEFIHGHLRETVALLEEYRIPFIRTTGRMYFGNSGQFTERVENTEHWDSLLDKMKQLKSDLPFLQFLLDNFNGDGYRKLRESAIRYAAGFDLADVRTASTRSLIEEWEVEEQEQFRVPAGYGQLTAALTEEFLGAGGEIFLNAGVSEVRWAKHAVVATAGSETFHAKKLLITCPAGVMTHQTRGLYSLPFQPEIEEKRAVLRKIGFGAVIKIVLFWRDAFWKEYLTEAQFILTEQEIPTWWTQSPEDAAVLVGWLGGPPADNFAALTDLEIVDMALNNLSALFKIPYGVLREKLQDVRVFNWRNDPCTRGAYSFELAGAGQAKNIWKAPLEETLYFAGEACYEGPHGGTVEAAILSGLESGRDMARLPV